MKSLVAAIIFGTRIPWRLALTGILIVSIGFGSTAHASGRSGAPTASTCVSGVGPGEPPPPNLTFGYEGFHAAWYGQSGYPTLCPGDRSTATVAFYNTGTRGWIAGRMGEVAYLGTWNPIPGQDQPSVLGGDGQLSSPDTGWPRYNRIATQPAYYVGPGQVAWFQFTIQAPLTPGTYRLHLRALIEGAQWLEDYGIYWPVTVLDNSAAVVPVPPPPPAPTPTPAPPPTASAPPPAPIGPTIVSVSASPRIVDAGSSVTVTARVTDAQSSVASVGIRYSYPQPATDVLAFTDFPAFTLIDGTPSDGTWQTTFTVPRASISGTWPVDLMRADDTGGNVFIQRGHENPLFVDASFTVAASSDRTPPSIVSLGVSPRSMPAGGSVTVTAHVTDADPGVVSVSICYSQPNGQAFCASLGLSNAGGGSAVDGVWSIGFNAGSTPGAWTVSSVVATDAAGNRSTLLPPTPPSGDGAFSVTATSDTTAPNIASLAVSPTSVSAGGSVTVTAHITDADTGVAWSGVCYDAPSGVPSPVGCPNLALVLGTPQDGTWQVNIMIPAGSAPGTWMVRSVGAGDSAGNRVDVVAPGAPTADGSFTVR